MPAVDEEAAKELRLREREAEQPWRRGAATHSAELGAACAKHLTRLKVGAGVVRVLSAFDLGGELDKIALRGGYGMPGWVGQWKGSISTARAQSCRAARVPRRRKDSCGPRRA